MAPPMAGEAVRTGYNRPIPASDCGNDCPEGDRHLLQSCDAGGPD
jgi:hypothetical protein